MCLFHPTLQESLAGCNPQMMGEPRLMERLEFSVDNLRLLVIGILLQRPKENRSDCGSLELRMFLFRPPTIMLLDLGTNISLGDSPMAQHKESACNSGDTGDAGLIPGSERSPGEGNGNLLHYSCLGNPMDRGGWWATLHWVAKTWTRLRN